MQENIKRLVGSMKLSPPATEEAIRRAELGTGMTFPAPYREFMLESNGAVGWIGENSFLAIWEAEEIVQANN